MRLVECRKHKSVTFPIAQRNTSPLCVRHCLTYKAFCHKPVNPQAVFSHFWALIICQTLLRTTVRGCNSMSKPVPMSNHATEYNFFSLPLHSESAAVVLICTAYRPLMHDKCVYCSIVSRVCVTALHSVCVCVCVRAQRASDKDCHSSTSLCSFTICSPHCQAKW